MDERCYLKFYISRTDSRRTLCRYLWYRKHLYAGIQESWFSDVRNWHWMFQWVLNWDCEGVRKTSPQWGVIHNRVVAGSGCNKGLGTWHWWNMRYTKETIMGARMHCFLHSLFFPTICNSSPNAAETARIINGEGTLVIKIFGMYGGRFYTIDAEILLSVECETLGVIMKRLRIGQCQAGLHDLP